MREKIEALIKEYKARYKEICDNDNKSHSSYDLGRSIVYRSVIEDLEILKEEETK